MRIAILTMAGTAALTMSPAFAATNTIDAYSFAGGRDAKVMASVPSPTMGRSAMTTRAFSRGDVSHAFALWAIPPR